MSNDFFLLDGILSPLDEKIFSIDENISEFAGKFSATDENISEVDEKVSELTEMVSANDEKTSETPGKFSELAENFFLSVILRKRRIYQ